jgi:hypothetical protein
LPAPTSGPHRLNRRGDRCLNHALHIAAITQLRNDTPGRAYFDKKLTEGKRRREDRVDPTNVHVGARHPRNNPDWPAVGILAQRARGATSS